MTDQAVFDAELVARRERVGLWRDAEPVAPWEWRYRLKADSIGTTN
jgi:micrococcal nuclease